MTADECQAEALERVTYLDDEGVEPTDYLEPIAYALLSIAQDMSAIRAHLDRKEATA